MRNIKVNTLYKYFKGNIYYVENIALDCETLEEVVVYRSVKENKIWVRKLSVFLSEVDHDKYPDLKQKYRFIEYELDK